MSKEKVINVMKNYDLKYESWIIPYLSVRDE